MSMTRPERRARVLSGVPRERAVKGWRRFVMRPWGIGLVVALVVDALALWRMYKLSAPPLVAQINQDTKGQVVVGLPQINEAIALSARLALPTLAAYVLLFVLLDRIRPTSWAMRVIALGWGACVATYVALIVNSWAGELMMVGGGAGDPGVASRPAVFSAPFVEEAAKASIVFVLIIVARYRLVAPPQIVSLAGLSAVGFAFTENILYYFRVKVYTSVVTGSGDSDAQLSSMVWLRGVVTSFAHPTFTMMTAIGLVMAVRARSKWVRIVAPIAGYGTAATLHMLFNGFASVIDEQAQVWIYVAGWALVIVMVVMYVRQLFKHGRRIRVRLGDYATMGWITPRDAEVYSRLWWRGKLVAAASLRGWRVLRATVALEHRMTELAYLRDQMTLGVVDAAGDDRARELIGQIRELRGIGMDEPVGLTIIPRPILGRARARLADWRARRRFRRLSSAGQSVAVRGWQG